MFKVLENGIAPTRGSKYSACVDLYASEDVVVGAGETKLVGLGVCIDLELLVDIMIEKSPVMWEDEELQLRENFLSSHYFQLMLRSSLGKKGLIIPNGVGVIDLDFKNEIKIIIHNAVQVRSVWQNGIHGVGISKSYSVKKGDKIAQIALLEHKSSLFGIESNVERSGGFGSSGK